MKVVYHRSILAVPVVDVVLESSFLIFFAAHNHVRVALVELAVELRVDLGWDELFDAVDFS